MGINTLSFKVQNAPLVIYSQESIGMVNDSALILFYLMLGVTREDGSSVVQQALEIAPPPPLSLLHHAMVLSFRC